LGRFFDFLEPWVKSQKVRTSSLDSENCMSRTRII